MKQLGLNVYYSEENMRSLTGSKAVMPVNEKELRAELRYRMSLSVARAMLKERVISQEEYQ